MSHEIVKRYTRNGVTVIWKPALCRHSGICAAGLPEVFNPRRRPWIELQHADSAKVTAQVDRCPSGALSWTKVDEE
jgi:putative redox protein